MQNSSHHIACQRHADDSSASRERSDRNKGSLGVRRRGERGETDLRKGRRERERERERVLCAPRFVFLLSLTQNRTPLAQSLRGEGEHACAH